MVNSLSLCLAPLALAACALARPGSGPTTAPSRIVEGSYIVEVDPDAPNLAKRDLTHEAVSRHRCG